MPGNKRPVLQVHVRINGRVQGVGFRAATQQAASAFGLTGWVRNLPSGEVEAQFEGPAAVVEEMLRWCHQGPALAHVEHVAVQGRREDASGELAAFEIRYC